MVVTGMSACHRHQKRRCPKARRLWLVLWPAAVLLALLSSTWAASSLRVGTSSPAAVDSARLNALFGMPLWPAGGGGWDQTVDGLLRRLPLRLESSGGGVRAVVGQGGGAGAQGRRACTRRTRRACRRWVRSSCS